MHVLFPIAIIYRPKCGRTLINGIGSQWRTSRLLHREVIRTGSDHDAGSVGQCVGSIHLPADALDGRSGLFQRAGSCAQPMNFVAGMENQEDAANQNQLPFMLPVQPTEIGEAIEDFRRFAGRKQWEKAFKHLEKVFSATSNGLVLTDSGIMLPSRLIARAALLELPPAGQDAYRLFFDAEAKKLFEQAKGPEELNKLTQIFAKYLITSVGDEAANRLGDLHFEAGNFAQAINAWRAILEERPDSRISKARLRVKIGVALARLRNDGRNYKDILRIVQEQHASEKLTLGGKEVLGDRLFTHSGGKGAWLQQRRWLPLRVDCRQTFRCRKTWRRCGNFASFLPTMQEMDNRRDCACSRCGAGPDVFGPGATRDCRRHSRLCESDWLRPWDRFERRQAGLAIRSLF